MLFAFLPAAAVQFGGITAIVSVQKTTWSRAILRFVASVVFYVVSAEPLPHVPKNHDSVPITISFTLAIVAMLLARKFTQGAEGKEASAGEFIPVAALVAIGTNRDMDGLPLGIAFATGQKHGIMVAVALATELFSPGIAMATASPQQSALRTNEPFTLGVCSS